MAPPLSLWPTAVLLTDQGKVSVGEAVIVFFCEMKISQLILLSLAHPASARTCSSGTTAGGWALTLE